MIKVHTEIYHRLRSRKFGSGSGLTYCRRYAGQYYAQYYARVGQYYAPQSVET